MRPFVSAISTIITLTTVFSLTAWAKAEKVPLEQLPKPVTAALKGKFPDAKLKNAEKGVVDDKTIFEVALNYQEHDHSVKLTPDGKITEIEKSILGRELPSKVAKALIDKYPRGTNMSVVEVTKDKTVTYEIVLLTGDRRLLDLEVDSDGKVLKETERKEEKKP